MCGILILLSVSDISLSHFPKYTHLIRTIEQIIVASPFLGLIYAFSEGLKFSLHPGAT